MKRQAGKKNKNASWQEERKRTEFFIERSIKVASPL